MINLRPLQIFTDSRMNRTVKKIFDQHRPLCLASSSPRRKDMLQNFGLEFFSVSPDIDESRRDNEKEESFAGS